MTSKQKAKGNSWESELCKTLGTAFGGNFQRVPNSGAMIGGTNSHRKATMSTTQVRAAKGDLIPPDHMPKLNLEAKNYKEIAFHQIINGDCVQLNKWIDQANEPADADDFTLLAFKITRRGSWAVVRKDYALVAQSFVVYHYDGVDYMVADFATLISTNVDKIKELTK